MPEGLRARTVLLSAGVAVALTMGAMEAGGRAIQQPTNADARAVAGFIDRVNVYVDLHQKLDHRESGSNRIRPRPLGRDPPLFARGDSHRRAAGS
jgi:hypothetical protein